MRLARTKDFALRHYVRTVGYAKRLAHVVIGNQDTDATIPQVEYYILNVIYCFWIDARERLVEQDVLRFGCKSSAISVRRRSPPDSASPRVFRT